MAHLIRTCNATDPSTGKTIQHVLYDEGHAFVIYRWDEETDTNECIDETNYEGQADSKAARFMALGELSSLHLQALHDIHGETFVNKRGIKMYWADAIGRYVTIPENEKYGEKSIMMTTKICKKQDNEWEVIQRGVNEAERALALAGVEAELAKEEFEKARRIEEKARRRLAVAKAKARAILKTEER